MDRAPSSSIPPDVLVAHAGFVRRIAFAILRDDADADDATQEALGRGLTAGPTEAGARRSWLGTVVRNQARRLLRRESRMAARERAVARPEATGDVVDAVVRQETLRAVVDAVGSLDEPSRTVVLLRHYDDLPPREIAARLGLPVETVKKRLHRAHQTLRTHLEGDGRREGARRRSALAAFAGWPTDRAGTTTCTAGAVGGGMAMAGATKIALAAAAVIACAAGVWVVTQRAEDGRNAPESDPTIVARTPATPELGPPPTLAPAPVPAAKPAGAAPAGVPAVPAAAVDADVLPAGWVRRTAPPFSVALPEAWAEDGGSRGIRTWRASSEDGRPLHAFGMVGAEGVGVLERKFESPARRELEVAGLRAVWLDAPKKGTHAVLVRFDEPSPASAFVGMAPEAGWPAFEATFTEILRHVRFLPAPPAPPPSATPSADATPELLASLATPISSDVVEGTVLVGSTPSAGATVEIRASEHTLIGTGLRTATTDADGRFSFPVSPGGRWTLGVEVAALGRRSLLVSTDPGTPRTRVVIAFGSSSIAGTLYLRTGAPAVGRSVRADPNVRPIGRSALAETTTDAAGSYRLAGLPAGRWIVSGVLEPGDERTEVLSLEAGEARSLDLGSARPEATWRGVVRLASGSVLSDPGASLFLNGPSGARALLVPIGPDGSIVRRLSPGRYRGTVSGLPISPSFDLVMDERDREQDVTVPGVRIEGTVRWATLVPTPSGEKARVAVVSFTLADGKGEWQVPATPDEGLQSSGGTNGHFRVSGIEAGRVRVWASCYEGGVARSSPPRELDVRPATDITGLHLEVPDR